MKPKPNITLESATHISGACFPFGASGCTCYEGNAATCRGVFIEGIICGPSHTIVGACCLRDKENNSTLPCQNVTYCECFTLAESFNFSFTWNNKLCNKISCGNNSKNIGACCMGNGLCHETTQSECEEMNHFFQGNGTVCSDDICVAGTGGCCDGVTCNNGVTGSYCIKQNKSYLGQNKKCYEFTCLPNRLPCLDSIVGYRLKIGDLFEDGIVVGIYNPNNSTCWGNPIFGGGGNFDQLTSNSTVRSQNYSSLYDYNGYGVIHPELCENNEDSYIMIMSLHPPTTGITGQQTYTWSHGGFYYGPLIRGSGQVVEPYTEKLNTLKEGYVINTTFSLDVNRSIIESNSISGCSRRSYKDTPITRIYNRTTHNFNGRWFSDWGLHNTVRMVNAQLYYEQGSTMDAYLYPSLYAPSSDFDSSMTPCTTPIRDLNETSIPVLDITGSWFIPSINELSFISYQCKFNNLNRIIQDVGGTPMFGTYWSSTGTFNYTGVTGEGYSNGATADIGTYAWAANFDGVGSVEKAHRLTSKKIRPIRLIRCDGKTLKNTKYSSITEVNY